MNNKAITLLFFIFHSYLLIASSFVITNGLTHELKVAKGSIYRGSINIENISSKEKSIKIYLQDYRYYASGEVFYESPTLKNNPRSNARWVHFSSNFITLKPKAKHNIDYEIYVPDNLTNDGTYWCLAMLEGINDEEFEPRGKEQVQIRSLVRYGVQLITHVGQTARKDLSFEQFRLNYNELNQAFLSFDLLNTGALLLKPQFKIELFNDKGQSVTVFEKQGARIYPQMSTRNTIPLNNISPGIYKALVLVDTQNDDIFATEINLEIKTK